MNRIIISIVILGVMSVCCFMSVGYVDSFTDMLWNSLNADNKVSLFVRYIDIETGNYETRIVNKNQ